MGGFSGKMLVLYIILGVLLLCLYFIVDFIVARKFKQIAIEKGQDADKLHVFAMCFWLNIIGYLYVIALPNKKQ